VKEVLESITEVFKSSGFRVVFAEQSEIYMLVPEDEDERRKFGIPCLSPRAMAALDAAMTRVIEVTISTTMSTVLK
jgi:hypothetical protein